MQSGSLRLQGRVTLKSTSSTTEADKNRVVVNLFERRKIQCSWATPKMIDVQGPDKICFAKNGTLIVEFYNIQLYVYIYTHIMNEYVTVI